jgi:probable addiction module antidote protein
MAKNLKSYTQGLSARLRDNEYAAEYLSAAAESGQEELLLALRDIARARGMSRIAKMSHKGRESLYKALSKDGNPGLETLLSILRATHIKLHFQAA